MQAGFAFLEAGSVRSKNTTNILIKNTLDFCKYEKVKFIKKGSVVYQKRLTTTYTELDVTTNIITQQSRFSLIYRWIYIANILNPVL